MPVDFEAAAAEMRRAGDNHISIDFDAPQAIAILVILQFVLRHPSADDSFAWEVARRSASALERFLASLGPNVAALAAAGWDPEENL